MASSHWLTQINCYDNTITGENWAVSHIIRSLWDKTCGRWRSEKKFPSKRGGTIAESCHCRAWQLRRWAKCVLSHPYIVFQSYHPTHHEVSASTGLSLFLLCSLGTQCRLEEQDRDKACHNWTLSLEPGTSRSSIFILMAKQRGLLYLWLEKVGNVFFLFGAFTLKYLFVG